MIKDFVLFHKKKGMKMFPISICFIFKQQQLLVCNN